MGGKIILGKFLTNVSSLTVQQSGDIRDKVISGRIRHMSSLRK